MITCGKTHPELTDPLLRSILANEMLVVRRTLHVLPKSDPWVAGIFLGLETLARRVQDVNTNGLNAVYMPCPPIQINNVTALSEVVTLFNNQDNRINAAD